jgi:nucleoside-diphosphate-sugar epimerase
MDIRMRGISRAFFRLAIASLSRYVPSAFLSDSVTWRQRHASARTPAGSSRRPPALAQQSRRLRIGKPARPFQLCKRLQTTTEVTDVPVAIITGSAGLVGSTAAEYFCSLGFDVVGVDNDMRGQLFGQESSTAWQRCRLEEQLGRHYTHVDLDIRDADGLTKIFARYRAAIELVIHAAAQPSHDWAAKDPVTDFTINANGTLNLLEASRRVCPDAVVVFVSTNKVYGDNPNRLPLVEMTTRWEIARSHTYHAGIREDMSIDTCLRSLFGASKLAADILVQEYARYFGMKTVCFRGGCLSGPSDSGAPLHGLGTALLLAAVTLPGVHDEVRCHTPALHDLRLPW